MTVGAEHETPRPPEGEGFSDAVTFAFGDAERELYGVARVGLAGGSASGLALMFEGAETVAVRAAGWIEVAEPAWEAIDAAGIRTQVAEPLRRWNVQFDSEDGRSGFHLTFEAVSPPARLDPDHPAARAGGMEGYDQLCRVTGEATVDGRRIAVSGRGQRGHSWGTPDWERIELARTLSAWLDGDAGVSLTAVRPRGTRSHEDEATAAYLFVPAAEDGAGSARGGAGDGGSPGDGAEHAGRPEAQAVPIAEPLLSTTYDGEGRQRHAGLELYVTEDDWPRRAAGEVVAGTTLDLGRLRLDCAFFRWQMDGRSGIGRYDVLRRA
jgi:hypothetical protein